MTEVVIKDKDTNREYKFLDVTDENNNAEAKALTEFNEWSHDFSEASQELSFMGAPKLSKVHFHTMKFASGGVYIWIGDEPFKFENMTCAMHTPYAREPLTTCVFSTNSTNYETSNETCCDLACKLSKRLKKQVFVSMNVSFSAVADADTQNNCVKLIEMALFKEIKSNPEKF